MTNRQIFLDTETTGLSVHEGHRVIEIGCIELVNRKRTGETYWKLLNPERAIDKQATLVHGFSDADVSSAPTFRSIAAELWGFLKGAELVAHNASFDLGFLNSEFALCGYPQTLDGVCTIVDSLAMARGLHPGQSNSLNALCRRYDVDLSGRRLHGALRDAELLVDVYLRMTAGQSMLSLNTTSAVRKERRTVWDALNDASTAPLPIVAATPLEELRHGERMQAVYCVHIKSLNAQIAALTGEARKLQSDIEQTAILIARADQKKRKKKDQPDKVRGEPVKTREELEEQRCELERRLQENAARLAATKATLQAAEASGPNIF